MSEMTPDTSMATGVSCPNCEADLEAGLQVKGRPVNPVDGPVVATITIRLVACPDCGFREEYE